MMHEIRISSWTELQEALYEDSWQEALGRYRSTWVFRGMSTNTGLNVGLQRLSDDFAGLEKHLIRNFRKYARQAADGDDSIWYWLALAQHHGLPTRLLDWTYSPLVALHFATCDTSKFSEDGAVWSINYQASNQLLPESLKRALKKEEGHAFTTEMLDAVANNLQDFDQLSTEPFVAFLEPPSIDARIVNQFALFSITSQASCRLDHWLEEREHLARKLVIPASLKWEVRDKLDQANITERLLMPGLDGLCAWLKRYYSPRDRAAPEKIPYTP